MNDFMLTMVLLISVHALFFNQIYKIHLPLLFSNFFCHDYSCFVVFEVRNSWLKYIQAINRCFQNVWLSNTEFMIICNIINNQQKIHSNLQFVYLSTNNNL